MPERDYAVLHEHFVKVYGLDEGVVTDDGGVRFERQLVKPKEAVWQLLDRRGDGCRRERAAGRVRCQGH